MERAVVEPAAKSRRMVRPPIMGVTAKQIPARSNEELAVEGWGNGTGLFEVVIHGRADPAVVRPLIASGVR